MCATLSTGRRVVAATGDTEARTLDFTLELELELIELELLLELCDVLLRDADVVLGILIELLDHLRCDLGILSL